VAGRVWAAELVRLGVLNIMNIEDDSSLSNPPLSRSEDNTPEPTENVNSKIGLFCLITSVTSGVLIVLIFAIMVVIKIQDPSNYLTEGSTSSTLFGLGILATLSLALIALGMGVAGFIERGYKKTFCLIGLIISCLIPLGFFGYLIFVIARI